MSLFKDIHHSAKYETDLLEQVDSLMVELEDFLDGRFSIKEMEYNPDGSVEWNPEQAKPPASMGRGGAGGITRDSGAGMQRRREASASPSSGDIVITSDEQGRVVPAVITSVEQNTAIILNRRSNLKQKIDLTTLRQAQGNVAQRFSQKYPDKKFWQVNS